MHTFMHKLICTYIHSENFSDYSNIGYIVVITHYVWFHNLP